MRKRIEREWFLMPPKQRFNREIILDRAYEMFLKNGMGSVNARSVSKALQCSTQPIFSYFPDMNGLRTALIEKANSEFSARIQEPETAEPSSFVKRSMAYVRFAAEQPNVFLHLCSSNVSPEFMPCSLLLVPPETVISAEQAALRADRAAVLAIHDKLSVYVHGLASLTALGICAFDEKAHGEKVKTMYETLAHGVN